jgi:hypothetical protein
MGKVKKATKKVVKKTVKAGIKAAVIVLASECGVTIKPKI